MLKAFKSTLRLFLKQDVSANSEKALIHAELSGSAIFEIWKSLDRGGTFSLDQLQCQQFSAFIWPTNVPSSDISKPL